MNLRHGISALILGILSLTASAAGPAEADSLARALATYWGSAFRTADLVTPLQKQEFVNGLADALERDTVTGDAYLRGVSMGVSILNGFEQMKGLGMDATRSVLVSSILDVARGGSVGFTPDGAAAYIDSCFAAATALTAESQQAFVSEAASQPGAVTTPSGLVFTVITEGEGPMPLSGQTVEIDYVGRLADGTVFDATDSPLRLGVDDLVPGFTEGLKMMRPGGRYRLVIPPSLAYGDTGAGGGVIPPGAAIDFTVDYHGTVNDTDH